jgi:hypothetical protein
LIKENAMRIENGMLRKNRVTFGFIGKASLHT